MSKAVLVWYGHLLMSTSKSTKAVQARGVWGHAPPVKFVKLGGLRSLLRLCSGQNDNRTFAAAIVNSVEACSGNQAT